MGIDTGVNLNKAWKKFLNKGNTCKNRKLLLDGEEKKGSFLDLNLKLYFLKNWALKLQVP